MVAAIRDWRAWVWPLVAAGVVLAITAAGVLTVPEKVETRAQKHPPNYVRLAALAAARRYGAKRPDAVEWIVTGPVQIRAAKFADERPVYKKDCLILVQAGFTASPGTPPKPAGQQRSLVGGAAVHGGEEPPATGRARRLRHAPDHHAVAAAEALRMVS